MLVWLGSSGLGLSVSKNLEAVAFQCRPPFRTLAVHGMVTLYLELLDLMRSLPEWTPSVVTRVGSKVMLETTEGCNVSART